MDVNSVAMQLSEAVAVEVQQNQVTNCLYFKQEKAECLGRRVFEILNPSTPLDGAELMITNIIYVSFYGLFL